MRYVGVPHGVMLEGQQLFFAHIHLHGGPAPVRRFLPQLVELVNGILNAALGRQAVGFSLMGAAAVFFISWASSVASAFHIESTGWCLA